MIDRDAVTERPVSPLPPSGSLADNVWNKGHSDDDVLVSDGPEPSGRVRDRRRTDTMAGRKRRKMDRRAQRWVLLSWYVPCHSV